MKKEEREKEERLAELLKKADSHPMMKAILAEEAAAVAKKRTEAAQKIEVLKKERDAVIPKLIAIVDEKEGTYKKAKVALDAASDEWQKAEHTLSAERHQFENRIGIQKTDLLNNADPALNEAIIFFQEKLAFLRSEGRISQVAGGAVKNIFTEKINTKQESNYEAILDALSYCRAAITALEALKLSPALDLQKIEELKKGILDINVYKEYEGERAMPKGPDQAFLARQDAEMDAKVQRLLNYKV